MDASVIPIVSILLVVLGLIATHLRTKGVSEIRERLVALETKVTIYFDLQEKYNAKILHRDDDKDKLDAILEDKEKLIPLPPHVEKKLDEKLEEIIENPKETVGRRAAAAQMLSARKARDAEC